MSENSPASVMKLVEVIPGLLTEDETAEKVTELLDKIGKVVTDGTGAASAVQIENKPRLEHSLRSEA